MLSNLKTRWLGVTILLDIGLTILALLLARWLRDLFPAGQYLDDTLTLAYMDKPFHFYMPALIPVVALTWLIVFFRSGDL